MRPLGPALRLRAGVRFVPHVPGLTMHLAHQIPIAIRQMAQQALNYPPLNSHSARNLLWSEITTQARRRSP